MPGAGRSCRGIGSQVVSQGGSTLAEVTVRRKVPTLTRRFGPVRLYLDDMAELKRDHAQGLAGRDARSERVRTRRRRGAQGTARGKIRWVKWLASSSFPTYLSLDLSATGPKVTAHHYDDAVRLGLENVADVLRRSRRRVLGPLGWHWGVGWQSCSSPVASGSGCQTGGGAGGDIPWSAPSCCWRGGVWSVGRSPSRRLRSAPAVRAPVLLAAER